MRMRRKLLLAGIPLLFAGRMALAQVVSGPPQNITPDTQSIEYWVKVNATGTKISWTNNAGIYNNTKTWADIYVANPDGSDRKRVAARLMATEESGMVSPDGTKVVMHAFGSLTASGSLPTDIWVVDMVTGQITQMTTHAAYDAYPVWNHDGTKIAFISQRNSPGVYELHIMNAVDANGNLTPESATNVPVQLSITAIVNGLRPFFAPDGKMVFMGKQAGRTAAYDLFIADPVDSNGDKVADNLVRITDYATAKTGGNVGFSDPVMPKAGGRVFFYSANLTPDGRNHVFSLDPSGVLGGDPAQVNKDIWQITGAAFDETYTYAGGNLLAVSIGNDDNTYAGMGVDNRDVGVYTLVEDYRPGSLSGRLVSTRGEPAVGNIVELYNGATLVQTTNTDTQGSYAFSDLMPGGYYVRFSSPLEDVAPDTTVARSVLIAPGGSTIQDAFTSPQTSRRPRGVIPTIQDGKASIRWQPDPEVQLKATGATVNWTYKGFNVWRSSTENGPWTKINTVLIPAATVYEFVDETPGDLTSAFYTVTSVTQDPDNAENTLESMYADAGQAANNILFNPSFEIVDPATGTALGWERIVFGATTGAEVGVDASDKITGSQSQYHKAGLPPDPVGTYKSAEIYAHTTVPYFPPIDTTQSYINGVYSRFQDTATNKNQARTRLGLSVSEPNAGANEWYGTGMSSNTLTSPGGTSLNTDWQWIFNVNTLKPYEFATYTRFSTYLLADVTSSNTARVLYDEVRYQVKRVGATGIVAGRVVNSDGVGVAGVAVTDGTRTTYTAPTGAFALRGVPTGPATITISYPGQPNVIETVLNVGGYRFPANVVYSGTIATTAGGRILLPNGAPAASANVRMVVGNVVTDVFEETYQATTDASGNYVFDLSSNPLDNTKKAWVVASLPGYQSAFRKDVSLASVGMVRVDLTLGAAVPEIQVARATGAITIDGQMNEAAWQNAQPVPLNYLYPTMNPPAVASTAYMLWDDTNIYVAIVANEPNIAGIKSDSTGYDEVGPAPTPNIIADDHVEVFLDPTYGAGIGFDHEVWQLAANANTNATGLADMTLRTGPDAVTGFGGLGSGIFDFNAKASQGADRWTVEMVVPIEAMTTSNTMVTMPGVGTHWRGLVGRFRTQDGAFSGTSYTPTGFAPATNWNTLTFVNVVTVKKGDLTGEGQVTIADVLEAIKVAGGLSNLGSRLPQGDVAGNDGQVTASDAARILRSVNGLDPSFPN